MGSSATLGPNSTFQGTILALANITLTTGATINGRALAINGAVTLDSNNISNIFPVVVIPPAPPVEPPGGTTGGTSTSTTTPTVTTVAMLPTSTLITLAVITLSDGSEVIVPLQGSFQSLPDLTPNEKSVAAALDKFVKRDPTSPLIAALDMVNRKFIPGQYDAISPVGLTSIFNAGFASAQLQAGNIQMRLENLRDASANSDDLGLEAADTHGILSVPDEKDGKRMLDNESKAVVNVMPDRRWGFFVTGSGEFADIQSTASALGSNFTTGEVTIGADYRVTKHFILGLSAGYSNTNFGVENADITRNNANANAYASWFERGFYVNGIIGGGYSSYSTQRQTIGGSARASTSGKDYSGSVGMGYEYRKNGWTIGPIGSLQYTTVGLDGFTERGSLAPLHVGSQSESSLSSQLGIRVSKACRIGKTVITPEIRAQWLHQFQNGSQSVGATLAQDSAASFTAYGPNIGRDSLLMDIGASMQLNSRTSLFTYYTIDVGAANYSSNSVNGGIRVDF